MSDPQQNNPAGPTFLWHLKNAAMFVALWFAVFAFSVPALIAFSPQSVQQSKALALVPLILLLAFNVGAMVLASQRAAKKAMAPADRPQG